MTDRELMQMALDVLDLVTDLTSYDDEVYEAIDALRARLAQPEPEPVFWYRPCADGLFEGPVHNNSVGGKMLRDEKPNEWQPLYTASPRQPKPEPVAWFDKEMNGLKWKEGLLNCDFSDRQPFYTAPPQREWQGLTDEERTFLAWESNNGPECVAMTEAKLKEKNT